MSTVTVTKKGQATIPKRLREKFGIKRKVLVIETEDGILLKPLPDPEEDYGSLKALFKGTNSRQLVTEARAEDLRRVKRLLRGDNIPPRTDTTSGHVKPARRV